MKCDKPIKLVRVLVHSKGIELAAGLANGEDTAMGRKTDTSKLRRIWRQIVDSIKTIGDTKIAHLERLAIGTARTAPLDMVLIATTIAVGHMAMVAPNPTAASALASAILANIVVDTDAPPIRNTTMMIVVADGKTLTGDRQTIPMRRIFLEILEAGPVEHGRVLHLILGPSKPLCLVH